MTWRPALAAVLLAALGAAHTQTLRFDFGTATAPLPEGYVRVTKDTLYSPERGYGWAPVAAEHHETPGKPAAEPGTIPGLFDRDRERGAAPHRSLVMAVREYHPLVRHAFLVDLPDGDYGIAVLSGDAAFPSGAFSITVEDHEPMTVAQRPPGQFVEVLASAKLTDGQLTLTFEAEQYWTVNAVLVYPLAEAQAVREQEATFFGHAKRTQASQKLRQDMQSLPLEELRGRCLPLLQSLCDWAIERDLDSNLLKGVRDTSDSIFINGNLARALLSAYCITGEDRYRDEALRWCRQFVSEQVPVVTAAGNPGGWWSDVGPNNNIYLADTGTATSALVFALRFMDADQRAESLAALERYVAFVREGTSADPQGKGRDVCNGWIIQSGPARGALGCGYYRGHLSTAPYTISTATTGCLMLSQLFSVTGNQEYRRIAVDAARWLLGLITEEGTIPYIIDDETGTDRWWLVVTYCGEALLAVHELVADEALRSEIERGLARVVERALREQSEEGIWGRPGDFDGQRSGLVPQVLWWYHSRVAPQPQIEAAVRRNLAYLLTPELGQDYGLNAQVRPTGFVGLALADFIEPGVTLRCGYLGE